MQLSKHLPYCREIASLNPNDSTAIHGLESKSIIGSAVWMGGTLANCGHLSNIRKGVVSGSCHAIVKN